MWLRARHRYERKGLAIFRRALRKVANRVPWDQIDQWRYKPLIELNINDQAILEAYRDFYVQIGLWHGKRIGRELNRFKKEFDPDTFEANYSSEVIQYLREYAGINIASVTGSLRVYLIDYIEKQLETGAGIREIARNVQKHILSRGFYRWQIERIVRTETTAAANFGAVSASARSDVIMVKTWISATDARTRRLPKAQFDHYEMHLKEVDEDKPFMVPGKFGEEPLMFPGDPTGSPGNIINCRCTVALVPKLDSNGDFVERVGSFNQL